MEAKYIVTKPFADKNDVTKRFKPGDELPGTFDKARVESLEKRGLVKAESKTATKQKKEA